nr:hypothetical protein [Tanacetum cinerariifolium]
METIIDQQIALDESLIPSTQRLRIGRSNFQLPSDIQSKESTLQVVYDVLRNSPIFRAFQVTADVPEIYMQEFWAMAKLYHTSIRFKLDTKKSILDLEAFREMLYISPRIPNQFFAELPNEEEILEFLRYLGHSHEIRYLTDVNVNKIYQPWRSFASVINKCLTGKSSGIDSFRLPHAQILWGLYHCRNVDFAYLIWEDFVYQVEHKNTKRSNEMYYLRFTKVIIDHFMMRKASISRRNRINWHYVRDDVLNNKAYKEYYAYATGEAAPKQKASARKKKGDSASSTTPPTPTPTTTVVSAPRLSATAKDKRRTSLNKVVPVQMKELVLNQGFRMYHLMTRRKNFHGTLSTMKMLVVMKKATESDDDRDEGSDDDSDETVKAGAGKDDDDDDDEDDDDNDKEEELAKDYDEETETGKGGDEVRESEGESEDEETRQEEEESFDPIPRTPKESKEESNDEEDHDLRLSEEARIQEEEDANKLYRDVNINQGRGLQVTQNVEDTHVTLTPVNPDGPQESSSVSSFVTIMLNPTNDVAVESIFTTASSLIVSLQSQTPIMTPSTIATITTSGEAPIPSTTIPSIILENLRTFNSAFRFEERLRSLKTSFSECRQTNPFANVVSAILGIVHQYMTQQMKEAIREAMEGNKSIQQSDEQRNLYKALVEAYDVDKAILDTYGDSTILKRRREDDDQEGPSAGSDQRSKRQKEGGEQPSASTPSEKATESAGRSTKGSQSRQLSASKSASAEEPMQTTCQMKEPPHPPRKPPSPDHAWNTTLPVAQGDAQSWISNLARQTDARSSFNKLLDTPIDFSNFIMNRLNVDTLTPDLVAGPTYELMRGSCTSLTELEYHLEEVNPEGQQYLHNLLQPLPLIPDNRGRRVIPFEHFINNDLEYLRGDVYSKRRIIAVTELQIVEWHDYKHLDWILVRRDDDKIYKFKEGDLKRLRLQDIEDMLLLLVQGKLSNLTVEERLAFSVSLRMFTMSIVIKRRVEDLQLG